MASNRVIGKDNDLIWHFPEDLKRFKRLTSGHHIIMGRKTFESIKKPLPNRTNIVISRQADYSAPGCLVVKSLKEAIEKVKNDDQPFVIGGGLIYKEALSVAHKIELTKIHGDYEGDTYFPEFDPDIWKLLRGEKHLADEKHPHDYEFLTYLKIDPDKHNT